MANPESPTNPESRTAPESQSVDSFSREPWREHAEWVWDRTRNRRLRRTATLRVKLRSQQTDLESVLSAWLTQLTKDDDGQWYWGGFGCAVTQVEARTATMELSSSGEDTFESLAHAAQWVHRDLIAPHDDVEVAWEELPLT